MTKLRGYVALALILLAILMLDPVQRVVVAPCSRLAPSRRIRVLSRWQRFLARGILGTLRLVGGAKIQNMPAIQGREGVLVLMNHQSVLDIPLVVAAIRGTYSKIVTRKRYLRGIPLISHLIRLYQYPVVDPAANPEDTKRMLASIREAARTSDVPLVIFPEGTRTKDGEIGRFKTAGLKLILKQRAWSVYVLVADGFWQRAKMKDFLGGLGSLRGEMKLLGPFEWSDRHGDTEAFSEAMRGHMIEALSELRSPGRT
ncbi:MAG: 1-acyl-sn-glycerol-3-phosphate acyltransferase [Gemmatimonadetes bacterium]|nr:1-acyl-sn-glycerol-3-phosphate acyltransferase [Gemmatimonadota bacterium]